MEILPTELTGWFGFGFTTLKPHLHALKKRHGTPNFWHRADDFKARYSQFWSCKRIGPKCNVAPVPKILGVPRPPPGGSLGTGKRDTVPQISFVWKLSGDFPGLFCCEFYHNACVVVTKMATEETPCLPCQTRHDYSVSPISFFHGSSDKPRVPSLQTVSPAVFCSCSAKMSINLISLLNRRWLFLFRF